MMKLSIFLVLILSLSGCREAVEPEPHASVLQISAGMNHTCAVKSDNTLSCWGDTGSGENDIPADLGSVAYDQDERNSKVLGERC